MFLSNDFVFLNNLSNLDNYTSRGIRRDGDKCEISAPYVIQIYSKEGAQFYQYQYSNNLWTRLTISEDDYNKIVEQCSLSLDFFNDKKSNFTYSNGLYSADNIIYKDTTISNALIKFDSGNLISVEYNILYGDLKISQKITDIGTTTIDLPTDFTEINS